MGNQSMTPVIEQDMSGGMPGDDQMGQTAGPAQTNNQKASERMRLDESEFTALILFDGRNLNQLVSFFLSSSAW